MWSFRAAPFISPALMHSAAASISASVAASVALRFTVAIFCCRATKWPRQRIFVMQVTFALALLVSLAHAHWPIFTDPSDPCASRCTAVYEKCRDDEPCAACNGLLL